MKIIITESQLHEMIGQYKDEVEIIYRDSNILCMIPKSQMTSYVYGNKTEWCQRDVGFNSWSKTGLLIRFLFKNGRKVRFTYFFDHHKKDGYYWANENGWHVLEGKGNPFDAHVEGRVRDTEKDILHKITEIPGACKEKVLDFIKHNKTHYDYCYRDDQYAPKPILDRYNEYVKVVNELYDDYMGINYPKVIRARYDRTNKNFIIAHTRDRANPNAELKEEKFKNIKEFKHRLIELINLYKTS